MAVKGKVIKWSDQGEGSSSTCSTQLSREKIKRGKKIGESRVYFFFLIDEDKILVHSLYL